ALVGGGDTGAAGASGAASPMVTVPFDATFTLGSRWYSTNAIVCGSPSSVTMKSFAVSPSMGLPFLSLTVPVRTISRGVLRNVGVWGVWGVACCAGAAGGCCADRIAAVTDANIAVEIARFIIWNLENLQNPWNPGTFGTLGTS